MKLLFITIIFCFSIQGFSQDTIIKAEPYKIIQVELPGRDFHEDGSDNILFPGYTIKNLSHQKIIKVPEAINRPHFIQIKLGEYFVEYSLNGKKYEVKIEIGEASLQKIKISQEFMNI